MEYLQPEAGAASGGIVAPKTPAREPFTATKREQNAALWMYPLAYLYVRALDAAHPRVLLAAFTLGFLALGEYLHRDTPRGRETRVWLGCVLTVCAAVALGRGRAWDEGVPVLFLHVFGVWWALSRADALLAGESGRLLPLDALDGFLLFPLRWFFLRPRAVGVWLGRLFASRRRNPPEAAALVRTSVISAAALGLFALAAGLLGDADARFAALLDDAFALLRFDWNLAFLERLTPRLLLSLPVGAYCFALLGGTAREDKAALRARAAAVDGTLAAVRGVPERVWLVLLSLFCALYALFFAVQGRYLFGAFTRTLPEGFIVSEYARRGFFELCEVMAVNFALLWLAARSMREDIRTRRAARTLCLALLAESLLLAVVALSKLWLYIDCFGFTPRRLQSTWLVCVLAFGCVCAAWSLARGTKTFRAWMAFGAVTLSALCLY